MRLFRIILYLLMLVSLTTCSDLVGRRMKAHTQMPFETKASPVPLKGIYFKVDPKDGHHCRPPWAFFLYADGSVSASITSETSKQVADQDFWTNPEKFVRTMADWNQMSTNDGHYFIRNNSFTMELTDIMPSTPFRNFIRFEGGISSDSTIYINSKTDTWCEGGPSKNKFNFERVYYKIYRTDVRPDSADMWFKEASWYKRDVWSAHAGVR
jgi:hypothetical protein